MSRTADLRRPGRGTGTSRGSARDARAAAPGGAPPRGGRPRTYTVQYTHRTERRGQKAARQRNQPGCARRAHLCARNIKQPRARLQTGSSTRTTRTNFARASRRWTFTRGPAPGTAPPRVSTCVHVCADSVRVRVCARYTVCSSCVRAAAREGAQRVAFRDVRAIAKHRFSASGRQAVVQWLQRSQPKSPVG